MKVGMNLLLWTGTVTDEHLPLIKNIKEWGADGIELPMFDTDASPWNDIATTVSDLGMEATVVACLPEGANLISDDAAERSAGVDFLKRCVDRCNEMGVKYMAGPMYAPVGLLTGSGPTPDEIAHGVECFQQIGEHAASKDVTIAIEALNRFETYFVNTMAQTSSLVDKIGMDSVQLMYDTFHANIEEKSIEEAVATAGKRIVHVHVSACDRGTPGDDKVDYDTSFKALKKIGYDGWLTIESFGDRLPELAGATCIWREVSPSDDHVVKAGCAFTRKAWANA